jgi:hypothetical protein
LSWEPEIDSHRGQGSHGRYPFSLKDPSTKTVDDDDMVALKCRWHVVRTSRMHGLALRLWHRDPGFPGFPADQAGRGRWAPWQTGLSRASAGLDCFISVARGSTWPGPKTMTPLRAIVDERVSIPGLFSICVPCVQNGLSRSVGCPASANQLICPANESQGMTACGRSQVMTDDTDDGWSDAGTISTCSTRCKPRVPIGPDLQPHLACGRGTHTPLSVRPRFPGFDLAKITSLAGAEAAPTRKRWGLRDWGPPQRSAQRHSSANHAPVPAGAVFLGAFI